MERWVLLSVLILVFAAGASHTLAAEAEQEENERIAELERQIVILAEEVEKLRTDISVPEDPSLHSVFGFGPAASKVYGKERGLSIGGYGEVFYRKLVSDATRGSTARARDLDSADALRFVLYFGYKFSDKIVLNTEIEFEHATTGSTESAGGGSTSVEFAQLDFLHSDPLNVRAGLLLVPMGFINEIHEPPFFHGVGRPEVERQIIPTTWRELGVGFFGEVGSMLQYKLYGINGFNAKGFRSSGLRGGRQKGNRALAEDVAIVGRIDFTPIESVLLGASIYSGDSGQDQLVSGLEIPDVHTRIWDVHAQVRTHGLELRGLLTMAHLDDAEDLTFALRSIGEIEPGETIANRMLGWYAEAAYDVLPLFVKGTEQYLAPFVRFESLDTQDRVPMGVGLGRDASRELRILTAGVTYKPRPNVVIKADYRDFTPADGERPNEANIGIGFAF